MKRHHHFLVLVVMAVVFWDMGIFSLRAQTTSGTDFWLTFGRNLDQPYNSSLLTLQIRIVGNEQAATGTIHFTNLGEAGSVTFSVAAGGVFTHELTLAQKQAVYHDFIKSTITDFSVHITSTAPVTAYAFNGIPASVDATNILPITVLGMDYYHISYTPTASMSDCYDAYAVVATQNNTQVFHNGVLEATLNTGQVYYRVPPAVAMTGSHITTDKPAAFFALLQGANVPAGYTAVDCLFQQLAPINTWGTKFFVPVSWLGKDRVRVMVSQNGTNISQTGATLVSATGSQMTLTNLNAGQWIELEVLLTNNGCYIQSDKPIGVCAYLTSQTYNTVTTSDPSQSWVPAIEQSVESALIAPFIPSGSTNLNAHYALVVTPVATQDGTTVAIGGAAATALHGGTWYNHPSGYSFYSMPLTSATDSYIFANPAGLIVMGYGTGTMVSYYYLAYSAMRNLTAVFFANNIPSQNLAEHLFCENKIEFRTEVAGLNPNPGSLKWYIDGVEETEAQDVLKWTKTFLPGEYEVKMRVVFVNNDETTIVSTLNIGAVITATSSPPAGGNVTGDGCYKTGETVELTAIPATTDYKFDNWTENDTLLGTNPSLTFTATQDRNLVANFVPNNFTVTLLAEPPEGGEVNGGNTNILYGEEITVQAKPNDCYDFVNWTEDEIEVSTDAAYSFTVTKNRILVANFRKLDFDSYAAIICNRVILLNRKKLAEDGYEVTGCKWYKNGIELMETHTIDEFSFSEGQDKLLETEPTCYAYRLATKHHGALCSTEKAITLYNKSADCPDVENSNKLLAYPNPVSSGGLLTVEGVVEGSPLHVYNYLGARVLSIISTDNAVTFTPDLPQGIYLIRSENKIVRVMIMKN